MEIERLQPTFEDLKPYFEKAKNIFQQENRLINYGPQERIPNLRQIVSGVISGDGTLHILGPHRHHEDLMEIRNIAIKLYAQDNNIPENMIHLYIKFPPELMSSRSHSDTSIKQFYNSGIKISSSGRSVLLEAFTIPTNSQINTIQKCIDSFGLSDITFHYIFPDSDFFMFYVGDDQPLMKVPVDKIRDYIFRKVQEKRLKDSLSSRVTQACKYFDNIGLFKVADKIENYLRKFS